LDRGLRLAEVLGALSLTTDLGAGVPFEKGLRTCLVGCGLAEAMELPLSERRSIYFAALLRSLGCTAHASTFAERFEDDVAVQRELKTLDPGNQAARAARTARFAEWAGAIHAKRLNAALERELAGHGRELSRGSCEVSATLGTRLGLPDGAIAALDEVYERYDGHGFPAGREGEQLTLAARVVHVAEQVVMAHGEEARDAAVATVAAKAGRQLDPEICRVFEQSSAQLLGELEAPDLLAAVLDAEPPPRLKAADDDQERVCVAFATFADLKGRYLLGHSVHVAVLAVRAAELTGADEASCREIRRSALLMDIGRVGVSSAIWDRPAKLSQSDWERVRLHSYWTERILSRSPVLARLAPHAAAHHERLDGSGYHRGTKAIELSVGERLLAAADVFAALTEPRPHRMAQPFAEAAETLKREVAAGRLDGSSVAAVVEAAGLPRPRTAWPNDLTDREVEVLRVLARGLSNREIADALVLSPRTVQHHLASVYDKIDVRTRAGAAVFAVESGLVPASGEAD
jgi:HD-GYP domain-containing protein (c-di-GMP phosphodiesterase class II)/DNA-binding CsgD family transcriptional regulator